MDKTTTLDLTTEQIQGLVNFARGIVEGVAHAGNVEDFLEDAWFGWADDLVVNLEITQDDVIIATAYKQTADHFWGDKWFKLDFSHPINSAVK